MRDRGRMGWMVPLPAGTGAGASARRQPARHRGMHTVRGPCPGRVVSRSGPTIPGWAWRARRAVAATLGARFDGDMTDPTHLPVRVSLRLDLPSGGRVGPRKIALLEAIAETG